MIRGFFLGLLVGYALGAGWLHSTLQQVLNSWGQQ
jgi:hypothetical protein